MPGCRLYVGNLYCLATSDQLKELFSRYGTVKNIQLITGTGYAYVDMSNVLEAEKARRMLDGTEFLERVLRVKDASPNVPFTRKEVIKIMD